MLGWIDPDPDPDRAAPPRYGVVLAGSETAATSCRSQAFTEAVSSRRTRGA
jgi:hypothetical protein